VLSILFWAVTLTVTIASPDWAEFDTLDRCRRHHHQRGADRGPRKWARYQFRPVGVARRHCAVR